MYSGKLHANFNSDFYLIKCMWENGSPFNLYYWLDFQFWRFGGFSSCFLASQLINHNSYWFLLPKLLFFPPQHIITFPRFLSCFSHVALSLLHLCLTFWSFRRTVTFPQIPFYFLSKSSSHNPKVHERKALTIPSASLSVERCFAP